MNSATRTQKVRLIGLVGGIASGKSYVAKTLADLGAALIDADAIGHDLLETKVVISALQDLWGDEILDGRGQLSRSAIAERVFGDHPDVSENRKRLEDVLHPRIRERAMLEIERFRSMVPPPAMIVLDVPLLIEAGWLPNCDFVIFVEAPLAVRQARAQQRGWDSEHLQMREDAQMPLEEKKRRATHVIQGDTDERTLRLHLRAFVEEVRQASIE